MRLVLWGEERGPRWDYVYSRLNYRGFAEDCEDEGPGEEDKDPTGPTLTPV